MITPPAQSAVVRPRWAWVTPAALAALTVLFVAAGVWGYYVYYPGLVGVEQPISFSHRFHVSTKGLSCILCHTGVIDTDRSGVPPLETCMLCHKHIIITYPEIEKLRRYYDERRPVEWVRVNDVPEFVYFSHQAHIRKGFDCSKCHGDVGHMDRVAPSPEITMGFCVQCHRDEKFSHDCLVCHR